MKNVLLSIIIPHYNESVEIVEPLFHSINDQVLVNFEDIEVIFIQDGDIGVISEDFVKSSLSNIKKIVYRQNKHNRGVSFSRNKGIALSEGKYLLFIDSDDSLLSRTALARAFKELDGTEYVAFEWLYVPYWDLNLMNFDNVSSKTCREGTNIHAKFFLRKFLIENQIYFNEELTCHEDTYFVGSNVLLSKSKKFIQEPLVWYGYNPNSLTRINRGLNAKKTWYMFHISLMNLFTKLEENNSDELNWIVFQSAVYSYYEFCSPLWEAIPDEREKAFAAFKEVMTRFKKYFLDTDIVENYHWFDDMYRSVVNGKYTLEVSFSDFMKQVYMDE